MLQLFDPFHVHFGLPLFGNGRFRSAAAEQPAEDRVHGCFAVDVIDTPEALVVRADLPGVKRESLEVKIEEGELRLRGERKLESERSAGSLYHFCERTHGVYERAFTLPEEVDADKISAAYADGVLTVTLPKQEGRKPRKIEVQVS